MQASRFRHFNPDCTRDDFTLVTKGLHKWAVIFEGKEVTEGYLGTVLKWVSIVTNRKDQTA